MRGRQLPTSQVGVDECEIYMLYKGSYDWEALQRGLEARSERTSRM